MVRLVVNLVLGLLFWVPALALAGPESHTIVISGHKFTPAELTVPAKQKIKLIIENQDSTPEEFESHSLKREKIIAANSKAVIFIGPLKPGRYAFVGEFHEDTAQGTIIAQE